MRDVIIFSVMFIVSVITFYFAPAPFLSAAWWSIVGGLTTSFALGIYYNA